MKKSAILMAMLISLIMSGCANKSAKIERQSPCACYDIIKIG